MALASLAKEAKPGLHELERTIAHVQLLLHQYWESTLFANTSGKLRSFLHCIATVDTFTVAMANALTQSQNAEAIIGQLLATTLCVQSVGADKYRCAPELIHFFQADLQRLHGSEMVTECHKRAASFFEASEDFVAAIAYYDKANDAGKVTQLLEHCAMLNASAGYFRELEQYYKALPDEVVESSPSLMVGMAMLCVLRIDYENAEHWYQKLMDYSQTLSPKSEAFASVREKLMYLDLAFPHREAMTIYHIISNFFDMVKKRKVSMPPQSICTCLPSVLNGGRDFSSWTKMDDMMYHTMKKPVEHVLGNQAIGLAECALCESKFEKGVDYHSQFLQMMSVLPDIQQRGMLDAEFVVVGMLARIMLHRGKPASARDALLQFSSRLEAHHKTRILENLKALVCHIALRCDDKDTVAHWMTYDAPQEVTNIWIMWRLQYRVKCEVLISRGHYQDALILLAQLMNYAEKCNKMIDSIYFYVLSAITHYRMEEKSWQGYMNKALEISQQFGYCTPIAQFGKAVLPLLLESKWPTQKGVFERILKQTRTQASFYPRFMEPTTESDVSLSRMELQVLALICQDKSNREIGEILGIKMPTVKTHVSHILFKLEVSRRSEAKTAALKRNLIEDYMVV